MTGKNIKSVFGLTGANAIAQILQFATYLVLARVLGPEELGVFLITVVISMLVIAFFDFGRTSFFTRELAFGRLAVSEYWGEALIRVFVFSALAAAAGLLLLLLGQTVGALTCLMVTSQYCFQLFQALPKSQIQVRRLSLALILDRLTFAVFIVVLFTNNLLNVEATIIVSALSQAVGCFVLIIGQNLVRVAVNGTSLKVAMNPKTSFQFGVFTLVNTLRNLDQVLLGAIAGSAQTGIYGAVSKWFAPLAILSGSVSTITANDAARNYSDIRSSLRAERNIWILLFCLAIMVPLAAALASNLVPTILGEEYRESAPLLVYLAASASIALFSSPLSALLQYFGRDKQVSLSVGLLTFLYLLALAGILCTGVENAALVTSQLQVLFQLAVVSTFVVLVILPSPMKQQEL